MTQLLAALCDDAVKTDEKTSLLSAVKPADITGAMLAESARWLLDHALPLTINGDALDVCGTGGDAGRGIKTFNISTAAAFVLAAGGVSVVKHGNKAVSSQSGSSDVLEKLSVTVCTDAASAQRLHRQHNLCFIAAPAFHPVLAKLAPVRRALGRPTFLNLLGPLCNPARTKRQLIGIFDAGFAPAMAEAACLLGKTDVMIAHSDDGLDEISLSAPTQVLRLQDGRVTHSTLSPADFGATLAPAEAVRGGDAAENAKIIETVFAGGTPTVATDIICLNASAGFVLAGAAKDFKQGFALARQVISEGRAQKKLLELKKCS